MKSLGPLFFLLMLVIPTTFQGPRGALLALLFAAAGIRTLRRGLQLDPWIAGFGLMCVTASTLFMLRGAIGDAPGALRVGTVYVLWPLVYLTFIGVLNRPQDWQPYLKMLTVATFAGVAMCLIIFAEALGVLQTQITERLQFLEAGVGLFEGNVELSLVTLSTLLFTVPFLLAKFMMRGGNARDSRALQILETLILLGGLVVLVLSGKRAFWVVVLLTPLVVWCLTRAHGGRLAYGRVGAVAFAAIAAALIAAASYQIDMAAIWQDFSQGFEFSTASDSVGAWRRKEQFFALVAGWEAHPFFGAGLGAAAADKAGQPLEAWAYELSYVALLFHVGIVGVLIYTAPIVWVYYRAITLMRSEPETRAVMVPLLTGMTAFLIANATNPYLEKFDYLWCIFLPTAVLNSYLVSRRGQHGAYGQGTELAMRSA